MVKFNHESGKIHTSLNISEERSMELDAITMFNIINQAAMIRNLFDNTDDAPMNMRTKTGVLDRVFAYTKNEEERIYVTWEYAKLDSRAEKGGKTELFLQGMALLYDALSGDEDQFIKKFISLHKKAKEQFDDRDTSSDDD